MSVGDYVLGCVLVVDTQAPARESKLYAIAEALSVLKLTYCIVCSDDDDVVKEDEARRFLSNHKGFEKTNVVMLLHRESVFENMLRFVGQNQDITNTSEFKKIVGNRVPAFDVRSAAPPPAWQRAIACCPSSNLLLIQLKHLSDAIVIDKVTDLQDAFKTVLHNVNDQIDVFCCGIAPLSNSGEVPHGICFSEDGGFLWGRLREAAGGCNDFQAAETPLPIPVVVAFRWKTRLSKTVHGGDVQQLPDLRLFPFNFSLSRFAWTDMLFRANITNRGKWMCITHPVGKNMSDDGTTYHRWGGNIRCKEYKEERLLFMKLWADYIMNNVQFRQPCCIAHQQTVKPVEVLEGASILNVADAVAALVFHVFHAHAMSEIEQDVFEAMQKVANDKWVACVSIPSRSYLSTIENSMLWPKIAMVCITHNIGMDVGGTLSAANTLVHSGLRPNAWILFLHSKPSKSVRNRWFSGVVAPVCTDAIASEIQRGDASFLPSTCIITHASLPLFNGYDYANWTLTRHYASVFGSCASEYGDAFVSSPALDSTASDNSSMNSPIDVRDAGRCWGFVPGALQTQIVQSECSCPRSIARGPEILDYRHYAALPGVRERQGTRITLFRHYEECGILENKPFARCVAGWCSSTVLTNVHGTFPVGMFFWAKCSFVANTFGQVHRDHLLRMLPSYPLRPGADGDHTHGIERAVGVVAHAWAGSNAILTPDTLSGYVGGGPQPVLRRVVPRSSLCCFAAHFDGNDANFYAALHHIRVLSTVFNKIVVAYSGILTRKQYDLLLYASGLDVDAVAVPNSGLDTTKYLHATLRAKERGWFDAITWLGFVNDSVYQTSSLAEVATRANHSKADVWAICDSLENGYPAHACTNVDMEYKKMHHLIRSNVHWNTLVPGQEQNHEGWHLQSWFRVGMTPAGIAWLLSTVATSLPVHRVLLKKRELSDRNYVIHVGTTQWVGEVRDNHQELCRGVDWALAVAFAEVRPCWQIRQRGLNVHVSFNAIEEEKNTRIAPDSILAKHPPNRRVNPSLYLWKSLLEKTGYVKRKIYECKFVPMHNKAIEDIVKLTPSCTPTVALYLPNSSKLPHAFLCQEMQPQLGVIDHECLLKHCCSFNIDAQSSFNTTQEASVQTRVKLLWDELAAELPISNADEYARVVCVGPGGLRECVIDVLHRASASLWKNAAIQTCKLACGNMVPSSDCEQSQTYMTWVQNLVGGQSCIGPDCLVQLEADASSGEHADTVSRSQKTFNGALLTRTPVVNYASGVWVLHIQSYRDVGAAQENAFDLVSRIVNSVSSLRALFVILVITANSSCATKCADEWSRHFECALSSYVERNAHIKDVVGMCSNSYSLYATPGEAKSNKTYITCVYRRVLPL